MLGKSSSGGTSFEPAELGALRGYRGPNSPVCVGKAYVSAWVTVRPLKGRREQGHAGVHVQRRMGPEGGRHHPRRPADPDSALIPALRGADQVAVCLLRGLPGVAQGDEPADGALVDRAADLDRPDVAGDLSAAVQW